MTTQIIPIAAALLIDPDNRALLVRKHGTTSFMQPGGKIEPGETPAAALVRELAEELGLIVDPAQLTPLGRFEALAANEPDATVIATCFALTSAAAVAPAREIAELLWIDPADPLPPDIAPLSRDHILPIWRAGQFH